MSKFWSSIVHQLDPYVPGEQPQDKKYIKLNTNENPYPPSPQVLDVLKKSADELLRLYPDPNAWVLKRELAQFFSLDVDNIFVGNGSDEVLGFSFMAFFKQTEPILFADITYSFYPIYCNLFDIEYKTICLNDDFSLNINQFQGNNGGVIISNPNAPTGAMLNLENIESLLINNKNSVVIIDEAYVDFGAETAVSLIKKYTNLLVIQTFSKSRSLAGLRVGYAVGDAGLIEALERVKNSFNSYPLDRLALAGTVAAIKDQDYFEEKCLMIINTRERVARKLSVLGFNIIPSKSNFLFVSHASVQAQDLYLRLKEQGVLVRYFNKPRINNYLRISIGTDEEMDVFLTQLEKLLSIKSGGCYP